MPCPTYHTFSTPEHRPPHVLTRIIIGLSPSFNSSNKSFRTHPARSYARPHHGDPYEPVHGGRVCPRLPRSASLRSPCEYLPHVARPLALLCAKFEADPSWMRSPVLRYVSPADPLGRELDRTEHPPRHDWPALLHPLQGVETDVSGASLFSLRWTAIGHTARNPGFPRVAL